MGVKAGRAASAARGERCAPRVALAITGRGDWAGWRVGGWGAAVDGLDGWRCGWLWVRYGWLGCGLVGVGSGCWVLNVGVV